MNTHILLYQLRHRFRLIDERIMEREEVERETCNSDAAGDDLRCVLATGALMELRSESGFLAGLIARIEQEWVTS